MREYKMRQNFKMYLALCIFFAILPKAYSQVHPQWFNKVQVFQFGIGYIINNRPIVDDITFTGQGWGVAPLSWWNVSTIKAEIEAWHARGKFYAAASSLQRLTNETITAIPDSHRTVDLNGNFITDPSEARYYTLCSPIWQQFIIDRVKIAIDAGADAFHFDDTGFHELMASWNEHPGTFDPITMNAFKDYLSSKYGNDELLSKFDISDIESFNYGNWIKTNGMQDSWNKQPLHPLSSEYFLFLVKQENDFLEKIVSVTRQYSQDVYGREFIYSANSLMVGDYYLIDKIYL